MEAVGSYTRFIWRVLLSLILILVSHVLTAWSRDWDKPGHDHRGRQAVLTGPWQGQISLQRDGC